VNVLTKGKMVGNDTRLETSLKISLSRLALQHDISGGLAHTIDEAISLSNHQLITL
jgi:hypothetical protein